MSNFCSNCGTALNPGAKFCHSCGVATGGAAPAGTVWSRALVLIPAFVAVIVVTALVAIQFASKAPAGGAMASLGSAPTAAGAAPDLSTMSAEEQASRLFNRVMRLWEEGKADSAAFFAPMAFGAIEASGPIDNHRRYDLGMVALASGNIVMATAEADTILRSNPNHLLALALAARIADARKDEIGAFSYRKRLISADAAERATNRPEYSLHENDLTQALRRARGK